MEYNNKNYFNKKSSSDKYIKLLKKNQLQTNSFNDKINNSDKNNFYYDDLNKKIIELTNKLEFCKNYSTKCYDESDKIFLTNSINIIEELILQLDKNIIEKAKFNRTSKLIELEF